MAVTGVLLKIIQSLYERMLTDLRADRDEWKEIAQTQMDVNAAALDAVEHTTQRRRP